MARGIASSVVLFLALAGSAVAADREVGATDLRGLGWRSVGPANMGGRVSAIALVPGSRRSLYVGYGTGGLFKSDNLGVTFTPVFDEYPVLSIGSVVVADAPADWPGWKNEPAPAAPDGAAKPDPATRGKGKIVWVGTGEGNGRNSSSWGGGVYRSTDAGGSFACVGLVETHDCPRLAVDPRNPDVCYVAALGHLWGPNPERGVFKTSDGGATWQHVLEVDANTGACDVVVDPKSPDTVYAALYARRRTAWSFSGVGDTGGLFRSDDGGKTWKKLGGGLPARTGRIGIALYPKDPRILYATVESDVGGSGRADLDDRSASGGLFRSEDRGETWTRTSNLNFRPFYFSRIAVDPENDQRVYMPGWDLAISDDGGKSFRRSGSPLVHVDFHAIAVNAEDPNQIFVGNDGGVYVSHDRAANWDHLDNVAAGQFYRVAVDASDPYRIAGGLQDNGTWLGPSETLSVTEDDAKDGILNDDWRTIFSGDGFGVAFDPSNPNVVYATSQGGFLARVRLDNNVKTLLRPAAREGQERLRFNWNAPFFVSPHDPSVLYLGANRVFELTQRGDQWRPISDDLSRRELGKIDTVGSSAETYGTVVALAESPKAKGQIWAGTDDGRVHVTVDGGKSWSDVTPAAVGGLYVSRVVPSAHDAGTAYVSVDGHRSDVMKPLVLATKDLGKTWSEISGDLPAGGPVKVVAEDPASADVLYCGTEFGCFVTLDRGKRWIRLNGKSLPPAPVDDIVVHPRERDLVVGTHGRSIWIFDDASFFAQLTSETRSKALALFDVLPATPRLYASRAYGEGAGVFRAKNPPMGANLTYWLAAPADDAVSISIADASGFVVRTLDGPGRAGVNRVTWDLQADAKHRFEAVGAGDLGQTEFVAPGTYTVTITMGKAKDSKKVTVLPLPGPAK